MDEQIKDQFRSINNHFVAIDHRISANESRFDGKLEEILHMMRNLKDIGATPNMNRSESSSPNQGGNIKTLGFTPKVEFPRFDGNGAKSWVKKCAKYFSLCKIPEEQRVDLASLYMFDKAEV